MRGEGRECLGTKLSSEVFLPSIYCRRWRNLKTVELKVYSLKISDWFNEAQSKIQFNFQRQSLERLTFCFKFIMTGIAPPS